MQQPTYVYAIKWIACKDDFVPNKFWLLIFNSSTYLCVIKYQGNFTTQFSAQHFFYSSLETNIQSIPTKDIIIKPTRQTRSSHSKDVSLKCLDTSKSKKVLKSDRKNDIKKASKVTETRSSSDIKQVLKKTDSNPEKVNKLDVVQPKDDKDPPLSISNITSSPPPENQEIDPGEGSEKATHSKQPKHKIAILAKQIGELKKNIEASNIIQPTEPDTVLNVQESKKESDIEVVELSSDSEIDDDEFRRIFPNFDRNIDFDISDITDEELISSDNTSSDTSSGCILLEGDEETPVPSSSKNVPPLHSSDGGSVSRKKNLPPQTRPLSDIIIPELPTSTTISRIRATDEQTKSISKNDKKLKNVNKEIEVVDLE